jgi:hypothetical protein
MILQPVFKWLTKVITLSSLQNETRPSSGSGTSGKIYDTQMELFQSNMQSIFLQNSVIYSIIIIITIIIIIIHVYMQHLLI